MKISFKEHLHWVDVHIDGWMDGWMDEVTPNPLKGKMCWVYSGVGGILMEYIVSR